MIVPSSSGDVTRALRGCSRGEFVYVSLRFKAKENLQACKDAVFDILLSKKQRRNFNSGAPAARRAAKRSPITI